MEYQTMRIHKFKRERATDLSNIFPMYIRDDGKYIIHKSSSGWFLVYDENNELVAEFERLRDAKINFEIEVIK